MEFEEIKKDINERMEQYADSRQPTGDEVTIAWLIIEVERLNTSAKEERRKIVAMLETWEIEETTSPFFFVGESYTRGKEQGRKGMKDEIVAILRKEGGNGPA